MNSQIEHLEQTQIASFFLYLYISNLLLCLLANKGSEDQENQCGNFIVALIPGIGFLASFWFISTIWKRTVHSKGKCFLGHQFTRTYSSEANKWKNGRMPMRLSVGGTVRYTCEHCAYEESVRWSAF